MSTETLHNLIKMADSLTVEEQLRLARHLVEKARTRHPSTPRRKWRELRGLARPSLLGEDAQAWVSRTRMEDG
jgi:pyruvate-formate lyase-activating enzyme